MPEVLPIRANEETQARFRDFAAAGDFRTHTEFLNHLLTLYAAQETGIRVPTLEGAISAVNELADRINKVLIGAGETISANQEKERAQIEALRYESDQTAKRLVAENGDLKAVLDEQKKLTETVERKLSEAQEHEKKLDRTLDDKAALIDGYRDKINSLEMEIRRQKNIVTDASDAMAELDELRLKAKEQNLQIEQTTVEKEKALNEQKGLYTEMLNEQKALQAEKIAELDAVIRQMEIQIEQVKVSNDKALIDLEVRLRKEMNDQQTTYSKDLKEYEARVYSLLKEIENMRIRETKK